MELVIMRAEQPSKAFRAPISPGEEGGTSGEREAWMGGWNEFSEGLSSLVVWHERVTMSPQTCSFVCIVELKLALHPDNLMF